MLSTSPDSDVQAPSSPGEQHQEAPRKLAVLGLPWDTTEETLQLHFSQYGAVEATEIMKDRLSGKSRGFGFVTFVDAAAAARALQVDHTIDGRRCEAKVALPKVRTSSSSNSRMSTRTLCLHRRWQQQLMFCGTKGPELLRRLSGAGRAAC